MYYSEHTYRPMIAFSRRIPFRTVPKSTKQTMCTSGQWKQDKRFEGVVLMQTDWMEEDANNKCMVFAVLIEWNLLPT